MLAKPTHKRTDGLTAMPWVEVGSERMPPKYMIKICRLLSAMLNAVNGKAIPWDPVVIIVLSEGA